MAGVARVGREHVQRRTETQRKWIERGEDRVRREGVRRESVRSEVVRRGEDTGESLEER